MTSGTESTNAFNPSDRRIKLSPKNLNHAKRIFGSSLYIDSIDPERGQSAFLGRATRGAMEPLARTNGLIFPYTPDISLVQQPNYQALAMTHTNQEWHYYTRTNSTQISINSAKFTAQTVEEGLYAFAAIHFFRTVTKMEFGEQSRLGRTESVDSLAPSGTPPPVLVLDGYGNGMFNRLPVIVKDYSLNLPADVDYMKIEGSVSQAGGSSSSWESWVPMIFMINATLIVQNAPQRWRDDFNLNDLREGRLIGTGGKGWI